MIKNRDNKSFYDLSSEIYKPYIEFIWNFFPNVSSLYIRGSSSRSYEKIKYTPWDVDFVLGVKGEQKKTKEEILSFYDELLKINHQLKPNPPMDIRIINLNVDKNNLKYLHTLLLLKDSSRLIKGDSIDLSPLNKITISEKKKITNLYIKSFFTKKSSLNLYIKKKPHDTEIYNQKYIRLIKTFFRVGALNHYCETNEFSRSIDLGFDFWIQNSNSTDTLSIYKIINSFNQTDYNLEILHLCSSILNKYLINNVN
ncbi:hypothetical protein ACU5DF_06385 [Aliivibrio wodanis]|uniref:hypothetical protein n=1 Tax=Aliivibrio wodanis TaxID=80852 RepID=UPI00406D3FA0